MKIQMIENAGCFCFHMIAESMEDAAKLVRFGTNVTREVRSTSAFASKDGTFMGSCVLGKHKRADNYVVRRK